MKRFLLSGLRLSLFLCAAALPGLGQADPGLEEDPLVRLQKEGWKIVQAGVLRRELKPSEIETFVFGEAGFSWKLEDLRVQLQVLQRELEAHPTPELQKAIESHQELIASTLQRIERARAADASGESPVLEATCIPAPVFSYTANASYKTDRQGTWAYAAADFKSSAGCIGEVYAYAFAKTSTVSGPSTETMTDGPRSGSNVLARATASRNGEAPCESYAYASVTSDSLGPPTSYSAAQENYQCPAPSSSSSPAAICTIDDVPAATLLLPYFEVDLRNNNINNGINTLFSINNAAPAAAIAHVTLWTDQSIPTLNFDVYLTGYDMQTLSVRDIFNGNLPRTADRGADTAADANSPSPPPGATQAANVNPFTGPFTPGVPTEFDFGGSSGPCVQAYTNPVLDNFRVTNLRAAHTGQNAPAYGGCLGAAYGDNIARGYITVDSVTQCNLFFPSSASYFSGGIADNRNILWGKYFYVDDGQSFAQGETLVHIESCLPGTDGGRCPFDAGSYTFYGRYAAVAGKDQREPLATTFGSEFVNGGTFTGGTDLIVWRDSKTIPTGVNGPYTCGVNRPAWFPLVQADVVAFDETENPQDLCSFQGTALACFPLAAQRVSLVGGNVIGADPTPNALFGWIYLNLNTTVSGVSYPAANPAIAQAWVTTVMDSDGRFSAGFDAIHFDNACQPRNVIFIP